MGELNMVVQMYSLKYLARLFFKMTKKAERLAVFTPVEGETDEMLAVRIEELIDELRAFFYVAEADCRRPHQGDGDGHHYRCDGERHAGR